MLLKERDASIREIFSIVAPHIDRLSTAFSFGLSRLWRDRLVSLSGIGSNENILDVCTGTGELALLIKRRLGQAGRLTCLDFCEEMLRHAKEKMSPDNGRITVMLSDAKNLEFSDNSFDVVTVAFGMRNIPDTIPALKEIMRVLRPGGRFFCLELTRPSKKWFLPVYKFYLFRVIPFIGRIITKSSVPYRYLPRSIDSFYSQEDFKRVIEGCGFSGVTLYSMTMGVATIFGAIKDGQAKQIMQ